MKRCPHCGGLIVPDVEDDLSCIGCGRRWWNRRRLFIDVALDKMILQAEKQRRTAERRMRKPSAA